MNGFISHVIQHHLQSENNIQPRLPGRFESFQAAQDKEGMDMIESDGFGASPSRKINNSAGSLIEKPISNNQNARVDFGNVSDEIKDYKNNPFPKPEFETVEANHFEENTPDQATSRPMADRTLDSDESVWANLMTNIDPGIFVRERTEQSAGKKNVSSGHTTPRKSSFVFQENNDPNQNAAFFEDLKQTAPTIKVSIGRIEVRAIISPQAGKNETNTTQKPVMSLEDYLKKRNDNK